MSSLDVVGAEHDLVGHDLDVGVEVGDGHLGRLDLAHAHAVGAVDDLALQVGGVDDVEVDDADGAHAGRGHVQHGRGAQAAGADEEHLGVEQPGLALGADLGDEQVPRVARLLLRRSARWAAPRRGPPTSRPGSRRSWRRRRCSPSPAASGPRRASGCHRRSRRRWVRRGRVRAPRCPARCRTWRGAGRR